MFSEGVHLLFSFNKYCLWVIMYKYSRLGIFGRNFCFLVTFFFFLILSSLQICHCVFATVIVLRKPVVHVTVRPLLVVLSSYFRIRSLCLVFHGFPEICLLVEFPFYLLWNSLGFLYVWIPIFYEFWTVFLAVTYLSPLCLSSLSD